MIVIHQPPHLHCDADVHKKCEKKIQNKTFNGTL